MALSAIKALMPANRSADFAAEIFGVMKDTFHSYLPEKILKAAFEHRARITVSIFPMGMSPTVWVGIDPASHGVSDLGLSAIVAHDGCVVVIGVASINVHRCEIIQVQAIIAMFLERLRKHPWVSVRSMFVPIVECNNNEVLALSIVRVFGDYGPVWMPFTSEHFPRNISEGIGVWTTDSTKGASLQVMYQMLLEARIAVGKVVVTADATAYKTTASPATANLAIHMLATQLGQFHDDPITGKINGKLDGANDDIAMSLLMGIYWRICVLNVVGGEMGE